jgi:channel protein (hemolysin III family)
MPAPGPPITAIPGFSEPVSSFTHLLGSGLFLVLGIALLRRAHGHWGRTAALATFAFGCVALLAISGTFHLLEPGGIGRAVMLRLDHAAIFFVISGTLTAVQAVMFVGVWRWGVISALWVVTAAAITLKTIFFDDVPEWLSLTMYFSLGWIAIVSIWQIYRRYGWRFVAPIVWGGLAYTAGALLDFLRTPVLIPNVVGPHELFHLTVLAGLGWHWWFLYGVADERKAAEWTRVVVPRT